MSIHNGLPDGVKVSFASREDKHFPTATKVEEKADGSIEIWNERIFLDGYKKGEYQTYWKVFKERPKKKRSLFDSNSARPKR